MKYRSTIIVLVVLCRLAALATTQPKLTVLTETNHTVLHYCPGMEEAKLLKPLVFIDDYGSLHLLTIQLKNGVFAQQEMRQHAECSPKNSFLRNSCNGCRTTISIGSSSGIKETTKSAALPAGINSFVWPSPN